MMPAARLPSYGVTLAALFVIASGITLLQVAANPYVAVVGPPETALVAAQSRAGVQLAGHDARAAVRRLSDPRPLDRRHGRSRRAH